MAICRLCQHEKELKMSHITPKLFFKQLKNTAPTKRFRNNVSPNLPQQDGEKCHFLCSDCEEKFSKYERNFSSIYLNITQSNGLCSFETESNEVRYFVLSLAWRNLKILMERGISELTEQEIARINKTLEHWRDSLYLENMDRVSGVRQYVIPTAKLEYFHQFPRRIFDAICPDFHSYDDENSFREAYVTLQVPYLIFVTMVWGELPNMSRFEIGNTIRAEETKLPKTLIGQLDVFHKKNFNKTYDAISDTQKNEIAKRALQALLKEELPCSH